MIRKFISDIRMTITDPEHTIADRVFIVYSIISELTVLIALIADLILGEHIGEIITLLAVVVLVPVITFTCMYRNKIRLAIRILVISLVFLILPALFFFGGGAEGGGIIWIIFAFMYVGLAVSGTGRKLLLTWLVVLTVGMYAAEYYHPEWVVSHSRAVFYTDACISVILVGVVCFVMSWVQNRFFKTENVRAKKAMEKAEELNRSQNRFFSSMSHEIRTPINSILGLNELILRDTSISDDVAKEASGIQGAGKMLLALINDILDFSKMEAGSMDVVPVDYHVADLMSEIVNMIWLKAHDKGLKFDVTIDPNVPSVLYGDEVRIKQIIINLLNNAVKYTADGSVELHVESRALDDKNIRLLISISDTGMGIKKEALPYLFDAFKRVDEEKNRYIEGTGLGLSIVKQLVELQGGTITVNSVYGEGSTFSVDLPQGITDASAIGELNIHNQQTVSRKAYESSFRAPEARILIVDDNEMNLEVEKKLLTETEMTVDTVLSGREALELTLKYAYDVILMDHLMPVMDGIECLELIRNQSGGLNRTTPVIVLTANAGSENRDLYNRSGFDGYLVKPVSGKILEETLTGHIQPEKLILTNSEMVRMREDINTTAGYRRKVPVIITSSSMSDLPEAIVKRLGLPIIPFVVNTDEGVFKDGVQMDADELIRYIGEGKDAYSSPQSVKNYTDFFASALKRAHHLIHISITTGMSEEYKIASEAAKSFDNVTVISSGCLSSSTGILVLIACKLAQQNLSVEEIVEELEIVKKRLRCSFVIDTTEYMARRGLVSAKVHQIAKTLSLHPSLAVKNDKSGLGGIWVGSTRRAYRKYIQKAFPVDIIPDSDVVFITYADVSMDTLLWIREEISKVAFFEHVVFQKASAAISSNCGPGTFGILYFVKSNRSYNLGSFIEEAEARIQEEKKVLEQAEAAAADAASPALRSEEAAKEARQVATSAVDADVMEPAKEEALEKTWYETIDCIDGKAGVQNSGSEEAFGAVLKMFLDSIPAKAEELNGFYASEDWENYTIKVHALKSSAKLIGAMELSEQARLLEMAGKENNTDYIRTHHEELIRDYLVLGDALSAAAFGGADGNDAEEEKPLADEDLMNSVFEEVRSAAENMDIDTISAILQEMEEYAIPEADKKLYQKIEDAAKAFDYGAILKALDEA